MGKNEMSFFLLLISSLLISKTICDDTCPICPTCTCTCPTCDIATKAEGLTWSPIPNMAQCALGMSFKINECTRFPRIRGSSYITSYVFEVSETP